MTNTDDKLIHSTSIEEIEVDDDNGDWLASIWDVRCSCGWNEWGVPCCSKDEAETEARDHKRDVVTTTNDLDRCMQAVEAAPEHMQQTLGETLEDALAMCERQGIPAKYALNVAVGLITLEIDSREKP